MVEMSTKFKEFQSIRQCLWYGSVVGKVRVGLRMLSLWRGEVVSSSRVHGSAPF